MELLVPHGAHHNHKSRKTGTLLVNLTYHKYIREMKEKDSTRKNLALIFIDQDTENMNIRLQDS